jgi:hypothetical protein
MSDMAKSVTSSERMKIAREALKSWNLEDVIPAVETRINEMKKKIRERGGVIEGTNDFNAYLEGIKYNRSLFL